MTTKRKIVTRVARVILMTAVVLNLYSTYFSEKEVPLLQKERMFLAQFQSNSLPFENTFDRDKTEDDAREERPDHFAKELWNDLPESTDDNLKGELYSTAATGYAAHPILGIFLKNRQLLI